jgi:hypothetical protein
MIRKAWDAVIATAQSKDALLAVNFGAYCGMIVVWAAFVLYSMWGFYGLRMFDPR